MISFAAFQYIFFFNVINFISMTNYFIIKKENITKVARLVSSTGSDDFH